MIDGSPDAKPVAGRRASTTRERSSLSNMCLISYGVRAAWRAVTALKAYPQEQLRRSDLMQPRLKRNSSASAPRLGMPGLPR